MDSKKVLSEEVSQNKQKKLFTSESVTEGHPDKLCDLIADKILDACLSQDENSRVACEVMAGKGKVFVTGEITSSAHWNTEEIVRNALRDVGYCDEKSGMNCENCEVIENLSKQSADIALGVDQSLESKMNENFEGEGAGDQGMMFGFACDETSSYMPLPIDLAHKLTKRLSEVRKNGEIQGLMPDGKAQVTVEYECVTKGKEEEILESSEEKLSCLGEKRERCERREFLEEKPKRVDTVVLSTQHIEDKPLEELRKEILEKVIQTVIPKELLDEKTKYYINPTGRFVIGGPMGDSGLTGRKIIVDTYGGYARHGGGSFSGKDPTKVDRSATYMARHIAKNLVANGYAKKCEIQISYAIGVAKPVSIHIETFGTSFYSEKELIELVERNFDLTPRGIIEYLDLKKPIYAKTTNYGHFGKQDMTWEKIVELK